MSVPKRHLKLNIFKGSKGQRSWNQMTDLGGGIFLDGTGEKTVLVFGEKEEGNYGNKV